MCGSNARGQRCPGGVTVECDRVEAEVTRLLLEAYSDLEVVEPRTSTREVAGLSEDEAAIRETTAALQSSDADFAALVERLTRLRGARECVAKVGQSASEVTRRPIAAA